MVRHSLSGRASADSSATLTWLMRFEVSLNVVCEELFGLGWVPSVDPQKQQVCLTRGGDAVCVPLHPGLHVVTPMWAAQRIGDRLQVSAIAAGFIEPPKKGSRLADES